MANIAKSPVPAFESPAVAKAFECFAPAHQRQLLKLRKLIFDIANANPAIGKLAETLKWGQPSYLTEETKSGSTIRLGTRKTGGYAIFVHCQTTIIRDFQQVFTGEFTYDGNRAICFLDDEGFDAEKISVMIERALTYHLK